MIRRLSSLALAALVLAAPGATAATKDSRESQYRSGVTVVGTVDAGVGGVK